MPINTTIPAVPTRRGLFFGWYIACAGGLLFLFAGIALIYGFSVILPDIIADTGWGAAEAGGVYGLLAAMTGLLAPVFGLLINRFGPRLLTVVCSALAGLGLCLLSQVGSLLTYYLSFAVVGFGFSVYYFSPNATLANWFNKRRTLAMGIVVAGSALAGLFMPILGEMVSTYGWRDVVLGLGITTFVLCVPLSLTFREHPKDYGDTIDGEPASNTDTSDETIDAANISIAKLIRLPAFWLFAGLYFAANFGFASVLPHAVTSFAQGGIPYETSAVAFTYYAIASVIAGLIGGVLGDAFNKRWVAALGALALAMGLLGSGFATQTWHLGFFVLLIGPGYSIMLSVLPSLLAEVFGARVFPVVFGFVFFPALIFVIGGPALVGWISDSQGSYQLAWVLATLTTVSGVVMAFIVPKQVSVETLEK